MKICKHCKTEFETNQSQFANHVRWCKENPLRNLTKDGKKRTRDNSNLDYESIGKKISKLHKDGVYDERNEKSKTAIRKGHTKETKEKVSLARKKWLEENPDKHPWKSKDKFISVPCEKLKIVLRELGFIFEEEYKAISDRHFSVDIAFVDEKLALEVNGNQHYTDSSTGVLSEYYQNRHDLLVSSGWEVFEIHYSKCFTEEGISSIIDLIEGHLKGCTVAAF